MSRRGRRDRDRRVPRGALSCSPNGPSGYPQMSWLCPPADTGASSKPSMAAEAVSSPNPRPATRTGPGGPSPSPPRGPPDPRPPASARRRRGHRRPLWRHRLADRRDPRYPVSPTAPSCGSVPSTTSGGSSLAPCARARSCRPHRQLSVMSAAGCDSRSGRRQPATHIAVLGVSSSEPASAPSAVRVRGAFCEASWRRVGSTLRRPLRVSPMACPPRARSTGTKGSSAVASGYCRRTWKPGLDLLVCRTSQVSHSYKNQRLSLTRPGMSRSVAFGFRARCVPVADENRAPRRAAASTSAASLTLAYSSSDTWQWHGRGGTG